MPDLIDSAQLHATAQVAKSYILDQDTANVNTIINALQQGGGSTPATTKLEPTFTIACNTSNGLGSYTYDGDGEIFGYVERTAIAPDTNGKRILLIDRSAKVWVVYAEDVMTAADYFTVTLYASEGTNYAAKSVSYSYSGGGSAAPAG